MAISTVPTRASGSPYLVVRCIFTDRQAAVMQAALQSIEHACANFQQPALRAEAEQTLLHFRTTENAVEVSLYILGKQLFA